VTKFLQFSRFHLAALGAASIIGLIVGYSFVWATPSRAWDFVIAGLLWVLLISGVMSLARCMQERLPRGDWWRGIAIGCEMTFPVITLYMLGLLLASLGAADMVVLADGSQVAGRPHVLEIAPLFYGISLLMALLLGPGYAWTSPFGVKHEA
jgi:vacuolar-type H+-ATPase subunit I/STV1